MYVTDWQNKDIERYNKDNGKGRTVIQDNMEGLMDIHFISADRQTGTQTDRQTGMQTGKEIGRQVCRQIGRQVCRQVTG